MPRGRQRDPDHQIDSINHIYKYRDDSGTWWWLCTCSHRCWHHRQYRSLVALRKHQTDNEQRVCCPVDYDFVPPVDPATVSVRINLLPCTSGRRNAAPAGQHCTAAQPRFSPPAPHDRDEDINGDGFLELHQAVGGAVVPLRVGLANREQRYLAQEEADQVPLEEQFMPPDNSAPTEHEGACLYRHDAVTWFATVLAQWNRVLCLVGMTL